MRVLKFGGTSVANAERFLRVADILESNARQGQVATVLSAPAKITNHLVAMIEKTISGQDALPNISDAERIFAELLTGLAAAQPGFPLGGGESRSEEHTSELQSRFDLVCRLLLEKKKQKDGRRVHAHNS